MADVLSYESYSNIYGTIYQDGVIVRHDHVTAYALSGNDIMSATLNGSDSTLYGGSGNDTVFANTSYNNLYGDDGNDEVESWTNDNALHGGNGSDTLTASGSNNWLFGDGDGDVIGVSADDNHLYGGDGNDTMLASSNRNELHGDEGNDLLTNDLESNYGDSNTLYGGDGNDTLFGTTSNNFLYGENGDDSINVSGVDNIAHGGAGNDTIDNKGAYSSSYGDDGNDRLLASGSHVYINGGVGDDMLAIGNENGAINNVTAVGESGVDTFFFMSFGDEAISANIADFNALEDNLVTANLSSDSFTYDVGSDGIILRDANNQLEFVLNGIYDFEQISGARVILSNFDDDFEVVTNALTKTLREVTSNYYYEMPTGLTKDETNITVDSSFDGGLWLYGYDIFNGRSTFADMVVTDIDASNDTTAGRVLTGNSNDNWIYAGTNGAWMWGAAGDDWMFGGNGADQFWFGRGEGTDAIWDCGEEDLVNLYSFALGDITYLNIDDDYKIISIGDDDGALVISASDDADSTTIQLGDGSRWKYSYNDRNWSYAQ